MTNLYFIRHAESDISVKDERTRPLTSKGLRDSSKLLKILRDVDLDYFYSSPYTRSVETLKPLAKQRNKEIIVCENLRERNIGRWVDDFLEFSSNQWKDFDFKIENGESLSEAQKRNIAEIKTMLKRHSNENIVIGTHGTALSLIVNYFCPEKGYDYFYSIVDKMPFILRMEFNGNNLVSMKEIV